MAKGFSVTYERVSEESAAEGEAEDSGYVIQDVTLRDAIRDGLEFSQPSYCGYFEPNDSRVDAARWLTWYKWNDGTCDYYESGVEESRSLHIPDSVTASSRRRIVRLFKGS